MSRSVRFHEIGAPEVLRIEELESPAPRAGEVRIAAKALGLNRAESMFRTGQYTSSPVFPSRIGYEAAGIVDTIGEGVIDLAPGDAVTIVAKTFKLSRIVDAARYLESNQQFGKVVVTV